MTTPLTTGTQVYIDPTTLPITWQTGTTYTISLGANYVQETGNLHAGNPGRTANITTFATVPQVTGVIPAYNSSGIYSSTVFINYDRNIHLSTSSNYYLYKNDGTLLSSLSGGSSRVKILTATNYVSTTTVQSVQSTSTNNITYSSFNVVNDAGLPTSTLIETQYITPNTKIVTLTTTTDVSTLTNKQISINWVGHILPSTTYYVTSDQGVVYDMFNFQTPAITDNTVLEWTSGDGPYIQQITPVYNFTGNVTQVTIRFNKVMSLNTGNFYLNNSSGIYRTIPVISSEVNLINTNTVAILIDDIPTFEDSYFLTWDEGILVDNNNISYHQVNDNSVVKFYDQMVTGLSSRQYEALVSTNIFSENTFTQFFTTYNVGLPQIVEFGSGPYELRLSSNIGSFSHPTEGSSLPSYWTVTKSSSTDINSIIGDIQFTPTGNSQPNGNYEWKLLRNGVVIYDQTFDLFGRPYLLPVIPPTDPNNPGVIPPTDPNNPGTSNTATLILTAPGTLGVINEPVTFIASINTYNTMSGTVEFKSGGITLSTATISSIGNTATAITTILFATTGTKTITAVWDGGTLSDGQTYQPLTSNSISVYIDSAAHLDLRIVNVETPFLISHSETLVAQAFTNTNITGNVTWSKANIISTGTIIQTSATFYVTSTNTVTNTLLNSSTYQLTSSTTVTNIINTSTSIPLTITTYTSAIIKEEYGGYSGLNRYTFLANPTITVTDLSNPLLKIGNNLTFTLNEYTNQWWYSDVVQSYIGTPTTITQLISSYNIIDINSSTNVITLNSPGTSINQQWNPPSHPSGISFPLYPSLPFIDSVYSGTFSIHYVSAVAGIEFDYGRLGEHAPTTPGLLPYFDVFSIMTNQVGLNVLGITTTGTTLAPPSYPTQIYSQRWDLLSANVTTITQVVINDVYKTIQPTYYNTQTLGTSTFINNTSTLVVNSGTFASGTYTVFASWTGTSVTPKFYPATSSTVVVAQSAQPTILTVPESPSFYWHNTDGATLNNTATLSINLVGKWAIHPPTGIVKLFDGSNLLDSFNLNQRSLFGWNPANFNEIDQGNKTLTVQYLGDDWNQPTSTSIITNTLTNTTSTLSVSFPSRRNNVITLTTSSPIYYKPYGFNIEAFTTSTYFNGKLISLIDSTSTITTSTIAGTSTYFNLDTRNFSIGVHNVQASMPQDFAYFAGSSNIATFTIDKSNVPLSIQDSTSTSLVTTYPSQIIPTGVTTSLYGNTLMTFNPVNTATFTSLYKPNVNTTAPGDEPTQLGSQFPLYFNGSLLTDGNVAGQNPTYYTYFTQNGQFYLQAWRIDKITGQPNQYGETVGGGAGRDPSPILTKWPSYSTGTVFVGAYTTVTNVVINDKITRPSYVNIVINSTQTIYSSVVNILDNGIPWTTATYDGTSLTLSTSSSHIDLGYHTYTVSLTNNNNYYSTTATQVTPINVQKYQPGPLILSGPSSVSRPNNFVVTINSSDSFYLGKSIQLTGQYAGPDGPINFVSLGTATFTGSGFNYTATATIHSSVFNQPDDDGSRITSYSILAAYLETNDEYNSNSYELYITIS